MPPYSGLIIFNTDHSKVILKSNSNNSYSFIDILQHENEDYMQMALYALKKDTGLTTKDVVINFKIRYQEYMDVKTPLASYFVGTVDESKFTNTNTGQSSIMWYDCTDVNDILLTSCENRQMLFEEVLEDIKY
jgi:hypothetical protein